MNVLLGSLLLGSFCQLGVAGDISIQPGFDARKISGNWYPLAIVVNGELEKDFYPFKFQAKEDGSLMFSFNVPGDGTCETTKLRFFPQSQPGHYRSELSSPVHFVESDYNTFFIAHVKKETGSFLALAGREPNLTDGLKKKIKDLAVSLGFSADVSPTIIKASC